MKRCKHCGKPQQSPCTHVYVEIADGGPWLTQDLRVTSKWDERGLWPTAELASKAVREWDGMLSSKEVKK